ncbi:MAG: thiamine ABC transporter substrate-binding protein [Thermus sp.]|uniref:thiamine ABC transporter substrate-binding protein n=2 Tax=Thermus sp. TaxID=275 RepID=UPI0025DC67EF|nr:thiamine ABC transporter substrate-binding protein [Thermus sp.]MCS6867928.1 thiamine ABC transporter substrate-binding protein [Thermus sp.]MCS7218837.1 thiamine ABC transporter substrate-binding protein [Thermus sp.]MDW8017606.1 thiamine ABC transporter substrate-binding protein [Thermus sp.]MDW8356633.1 thiamine ABC transporter substrate-binding protein [Thermus sp.]
MQRAFALLVLLAFGLAQEITVLTHASFSLDKGLIAQFERETGLRLRFLKGGDAGETLNRAILTKGAPIADVLYGFDNTFLARALEADILLPYRSPEIRNLKSTLLLDPTFRALPVDYGWVSLNYDRAYFRERPLPQTPQDLARPEYARLLVVQNPATSSPGLAFLMATVARFGEDGYLDFWARLRDGGVRVAKGWSEAYYTHFTLYKGDRPLVVSYTTSPAAEVYYSEGKYREPPTGNLFPELSFFQVEFVGILKGTKNLEGAKRVVDWLLSRPVQENLPMEMWMYPARREARLPEVFRFAPEPLGSVRLDPKAMALHRERWIAEWTQVVLQGRSPEEVRRGRR